ncbi:MAG: hypothetical protein V1816_01300 [Pseudomonadota bacterium]
MLNPNTKSSVSHERPLSGDIPKVSVILSVGMAREEVRIVLELLADQTLRDFEVLILEPGPPDQAPPLPSPPVQATRLWNSGPSRPEALNQGLAAARGKYFTIINPGLRPAPFFLEALVRALEVHPGAGQAFGNVFILDDRDRIIGRTIHEQIAYRDLMFKNQPQAAVLHRREAQLAIGEFDPGLEGAEDLDFMIRIAEGFPSALVPEPVAYHRLQAPRDETQERKKSMALQATVRKAWSRRQGRVDLSDFYPSLPACHQQNEAVFAAAYDLGMLALKSPVWMDHLPVMLLEQAVSLNQDFIPAHINLVAALGLNGLWETALEKLHGIPEDIHPKAAEWAEKVRQACRNRSAPALSKLIIGAAPPYGKELFEKEEETKQVFSYTLAQASAI